MISTIILLFEDLFYVIHPSFNIIQYLYCQKLLEILRSNFETSLKLSSLYYDDRNC